jgi:hypothetical protein
MKQLPPLLALLTATLLAPVDAPAQARGPDGEEIREFGQEILSRREREAQEAVAEATMDEATRELRLQEMDAWLRRLPGRYRIKGEVIFAPESPEPQSGSVEGIADCSSVGDGPGVNCIINAKWPFLPYDQPPTNIRPSITEYLNTMRPSVLVFGMSLDPPRVVSLMVMGDSVVLDWSGRLKRDTVSQGADHRCTDRCIGRFDVIAAAGSELVTFEMQLFNPDRVEERLGLEDPQGVGGTITFRMERDPDARAEKPLRVLQEAR